MLSGNFLPERAGKSALLRFPAKRRVCHASFVSMTNPAFGGEIWENAFPIREEPPFWNTDATTQGVHDRASMRQLDKAALITYFLTFYLVSR